MSSRANRLSTAKNNMSEEKEKKPTKESNSPKGYEPDRALLDNSISTAIQRLDITNQISIAVSADTLKFKT